MGYNTITVEKLYCRKPEILLNELRKIRGDMKLYVVYGNDIDKGNGYKKYSKFRVIKIYKRSLREYAGFINLYYKQED